MMVPWIIVADSSQARVFVAYTPFGAIEEISSFENPHARELTHEMISDRPGRNNDSVGGGHHAIGVKNDAKQQQTIQFAKHVCQYIHNAHQEQQFDKLILVAAPNFLGLLRENLDGHCQSHIEHTIAKDLVHMTPEEIRKHLPEKLYQMID